MHSLVELQFHILHCTQTWSNIIYNRYLDGKDIELEEKIQNILPEIVDIIITLLDELPKYFEASLINLLS